VDVAERTLYDVEIRYATDMDGSGISLSVDGMDRSGTISTPSTGAWQEFTSVIFKGLSLTKGEHTLRMYSVKAYPNINWLKFTESAVGVEQITAPGAIQLSQNYPNPFTLSTSIQYKLAAYCEVKFAVYNLLGMKVRILVDQQQDAGKHHVDLNAEDLDSGVYIYRLEAGPQVYQKRMMLMK